MATEKIKAETRTEFGKGAARRIRREHKVPAVIYGHGNDPIHVSLPGHDTMMALKHGGANALLELEIEGTLAARADQAGPGRPDPPHARAHRLRRRPQGREGHRRGARAPQRRGRPRDPRRHRHHDHPARGRGDQHPRVHRGRHRRPRGRHPDPGLRPHPAVRLRAAARPRDAHRQHHPGAEPGRGRGRARRGRGRGRHRARRVRRGEGRRRRGCRRGRGLRVRRGWRRGVILRRLRWFLGRLVSPVRPECLASSRGARHGDSRGLAGGRPRQPRGEVRRAPAQRRLPGRRRAGQPARLAVPRPQVRTGRRGRGPARCAGQPGPRLVLGRPRDHMNGVGGGTKALATFYKVPPERIIAIHDELDLPFGTLRVKLGGGDNGHNGLRSLRSLLRHR